ncbi:MAG: enoyl-CoA hydratase/isomerase family protein [Acidimicrobiia bacterium]|nr:enoyl-CoA hydratase/isomerase family protein [Acidimicrobiia bacterium]
MAVVTLDRPEALNAFTHAMVADIRAAVERAAADPVVVGIVITGAGRGFCAGLDASVLQDTTAAGSSLRPATPDDELPGLFSYLLHVPKPVIAAVNGVTAGGGFVLATMCDLRFASTAASFLSIFTKRGLIAEHGTTWTVPRLVGTGHALDVLWSSRRVDAEEALRIGLVERVVAPDELLDTVKAYICELAAQVSPAALADVKRLVYSHAGLDYRRALDEADAATWAAIDRPDAAEGTAAMLEHRPPRFGRIGSGAP